MGSTTVSVIIPFFNAPAEKLGRSLQSVLDQSHQPNDIIVVDDGSDLPFADLHRSEDFRQSNIIWHALRKNFGVAVARNRGADLAKGDALAFLDTGDWWEPTKLEEQLKVLGENADIGLVYTSALVHHPKGIRLLEATVEEDAYLRLLVSQPITGSASSVVMPKDVFKTLGGFFEEYDIPEDRDLWLRVSESYRVLAVKKPLVHLEVDPHGRSMDPRKKSVTYRCFLHKHSTSLKNSRCWNLANYRFHRGLAGKYFRNGNVIAFSGHIICAAGPLLFVYLERGVRKG